MRRQIVAEHVIIASTPQLWQTWRNIDRSVYRLAGGSGRYLDALAELVAQQWNGSVAARVVMVGGALYQEVASRARLNVVQRIEGRDMRQQLATWAGQIAA